MSFEEAIALQPAWVGIWLNVLFLGAFVLPVALLFWKPSRMVAVWTLIASLLAGVSVVWMFGQMGYVKLLGLPHLILWTPLAIYLWRQIGRIDMPIWPRRIMWVILGIIVISLAFDYVDVARYILGERGSFAVQG
ncbi:hypothetical protein [uncultured Litoreibacter sp.]|uniref:hypothetical protein n=1 Tax=uncultured Litoreibacter sp. TaxID=1392394 RepID=UPI0026209AD2|nr:hypothetical protein [uncultured Litoreibacter sp.]